MADRNRELVPDNWSLVRERALSSVSVCVSLSVFLCLISHSLESVLFYFNLIYHF